MATIEISCCVGPGTEKYAEFFAKTCSSLASQKHEIRYSAVLSGPNVFCPDGFRELARLKHTAKKIASNHAEALAETHKHVSGDYFVIADTDMAVTMLNWDEYCISNISEPIATIGTSFHCQSNRYKGFPCLFFCMFDSKILASLQIDWTPELIDEKSVCLSPLVDEDMARFSNVQIGLPHDRDTAWKLCYYFRKAGYEGIEMPMKYSYEKGTLLPAINKKQKALFEKSKKNKVCMQEFHCNNELFATHMNSGRHHKFDESFSSLWRSRVAEYVDGKYGIKL